jgi:hypothetical protein
MAVLRFSGAGRPSPPNVTLAGKVKLYQCITKYYAMEAFGIIDV